MSCQKCGEPCQGKYCTLCADMEHQEAYYGVPSDNYDNSWSDEEGQTTLTEEDDE